jgi:hypothetical protein
MFQTQFGAFNGRSWEELCQQVFKAKYGADGYVSIPASPGDYGIEGYTAHTGLAFQCYCPEKHFNTAQLYENQRDKVTEDLGKLFKNAEQLAKRLGTTKIREWNFVSPVIDKNELLRHAKTKEEEARSWSLNILTADFTVLLKDGEFYQKEIKEIQSLNGQTLVFDLERPVLDELSADLSEYESNIERKSRQRIQGDGDLTKRTNNLVKGTLNSFLQGDTYLRGIESSAPTVYFNLLRLLREFELQVEEACATRNGSPDGLTVRLRNELEQRVCRDLGSKVDGTTAAQIARHMIARWLAVCQLDFD